ncbi:isochorismatase hydrolase [Tieghemostelium lacteum]|uniref:Isochorismatase hydrolase n=1 Tax=Tieghemostelium lacteum TaxID=361077 RepID=A0A152A554_TIELA|nr:isochorismatase hydrolase [Tieghemostelium lacteum]|eukprot:KYR01354.1 isochorismatase hydrolase [Tieghemostelium lacteum]
MSNQTALIIVDIQNDYFTDGLWPLYEPVKALENVKLLLKKFRDNNETIIHVQHLANEGAPFFVKGTKGSDIHNDVKPLDNESVVVKQYANSFYQTNLLELLKSKNIKNIVVTGMMTQNCIDSTVRGASEVGFQYPNITIIGDTTATRDLPVPGGTTISAPLVQQSFLAALNFAFGKVISTADYLK